MRRSFLAPLVVVGLGILAVTGMPMSALAVSFHDDFTPSPSPLWNNYSGNWTASGGMYYPQVPNNNPYAISSLPFDVTDLTVSVTVNNLADGGIFLHSDGTNNNGVLLVLGGNGFGQGNRAPGAGSSIYWHVIQNGVAGPKLDETTGVFTPSATYDIRATVSGNTYSAFVNGSSTAATTLSDSTFPDGRVGLYGDQPNTTTGSGAGTPTSFSHFDLQGTEVPEPTSVLLLGTALGGLGVLRRRSEA